MDPSNLVASCDVLAKHHVAFELTDICAGSGIHGAVLYESDKCSVGGKDGIAVELISVTAIRAVEGKYHPVSSLVFGILVAPSPVPAGEVSPPSPRPACLVLGDGFSL